MARSFVRTIVERIIRAAARLSVGEGWLRLPAADCTLGSSSQCPNEAARTNAHVTIPFEADRRGDIGDGLSGNVLEAAILSLQTHPDAALQAQVEARIRALASRASPGNSGFEVAAAYYRAAGKRDLLDQA